MRRRIVGIAHNEPVQPGKDFSEASIDVIVQVEAIEKAVTELGCEARRLSFTRDLSGFLRDMAEANVDMVFNLCESVDEDPRLAGHPAAVLELMGIPFSGSPALALMLSTDKLLSKRLMRTTGLRTPNYLVYNGSPFFNSSVLSFPVIAKPRFQDASVGIDQQSVFRDKTALDCGIKELFARFGELLVEEFIDGKEFNVSVFGYPEPRVLPLAEIEFHNLPEGHFPIVGYSAKWDKDSLEYKQTRRTFPENLPRHLVQKIERNAKDCFNLFMLRDYGRIDMRLDNRGSVFVLEANANPCLSPDAGFAAAIERAGIKHTDMVKEFMEFMMERMETYDHQAGCLS